MNWILIIIVAGGVDGGVAIRDIPMENEYLCKQAMANMYGSTKSTYARSTFACVQAKK